MTEAHSPRASASQQHAARRLEGGERSVDRDLDVVERALRDGVTFATLGLSPTRFREARIHCVKQAFAAYLFSDRQRSFVKRAALYVLLGIVGPSEVSSRSEDQQELTILAPETNREMSPGEREDLAEAIQAADSLVRPVAA